jgi:hypothetical protein
MLGYNYAAIFLDSVLDLVEAVELLACFLTDFCLKSVEV